MRLLNLLRELALSFLVAFLIVSCAAHWVADPSPEALASNDLTLAVSGCDGPVRAGFGVCRVKAGTQIASSWRAILPAKGIQGGTLTVKGRDVVKSYPVTNVVTEIPLSDFFGTGSWKAGESTFLVATAEVSVKDTTGLVRVAQFEGVILVRVLAEGYDPLPIDSGYQVWGSTCKVQYTAQGRSAVSCQ